MLTHLVALVAGASLGLFLASLCWVARREDDAASELMGEGDLMSEQAESRGPWPQGERG
jgi:hypothetical protein